MLQEYLISNATEKETISKHVFEQKQDIKKELKINSHIEEIFDTEAWVVSYSTLSNGEEAAKLLSKVDEWVRNNTQAIVLTNESSAYFNKSLFPIINDFERGLRKLLYLMSAKRKDEKSAQNIKDIEQWDLGKLFDFLFLDPEFSKNVRQLVREKSCNFTKEELFNDISRIAEVTCWDTLLGKDVVPSLRNRFFEVRKDRNHIMHAHNIGYKEFLEIKKLFTKINSEIGQAIDKIVGKRTRVDPNFNESLSEALEAYTKAIKELPSTQQLSENLVAMYAAMNPDIRRSIDDLKHTIEFMTFIRDRNDEEKDKLSEDNRSDIEDDTNENDKEDDPNSHRTKD